MISLETGHADVIFTEWSAAKLIGFYVFLQNDSTSLATNWRSFMADLRDAIHVFHLADMRLSQLPTPQTASSSSHIHRAGQRCFWCVI